MANEEQLAIIGQGPEAWNAWRRDHPDSAIDLSGGNLIGANLHGVDLSRADLSKANLREANLHKVRPAEDLSRIEICRANLHGANLSEANLGRADLSGADLSGADLSGANLSGADLSGANLNYTDLNEVDFRAVRLFETVLVNLDLSSCKLESCRHLGPSIIDYRTLQRSGSLPLAFLRGVGLPDNLIDYLPSLLNQPIQFYSCFISYSSKDQPFVERLYADLQAKGVRCWFAPEDMKIGAKILDTLDEAIRLRDKVLLVLSKDAIASDWVEGEVTRALDEERERKKLLLFPVRIDATVLKTEEAWARLLRGQRHIGDFTRWKEHDAYSKGLERLLRDLKVEAAVGRSDRASFAVR